MRRALGESVSVIGKVISWVGMKSFCSQRLFKANPRQLCGVSPRLAALYGDPVGQKDPLRVFSLGDGRRDVEVGGERQRQNDSLLSGLHGTGQARCQVFSVCHLTSSVCGNKHSFSHGETEACKG